MRPDVEELRSFYDSRQGQLARRLVNNQIRALWPDLTGRTVLGIGYAGPFLGALDGVARTVAVMPAPQGCTRWPATGPSRTVLASEDELPFPDGSVDRVLLAHALECCQRVSRLLREVWRVLADDGRVLALVPNRRGLWCWSERTPFGAGQPYSAGQLDALLAHHLFEPAGRGQALFLPPTGSRFLLRLAIPIERLGLYMAPRFAGVVLAEAEKRIYLASPELVARTAAQRRVYVPVGSGALAARERTPVVDLRRERAFRRAGSQAQDRTKPVR